MFRKEINLSNIIMSYKIKRKTLRNHLLIGGALVAASFGVFSCSDKYDLDSDKSQPTGLNSIYGYLEQQGNYTNYLRLINDLGEAEVLNQTGSNTVFPADDAAFARFFANNPWKVSSYESLTLAQKKLLLYSSMLSNPFSTSMLSTAEGPIKGEVFRRSSSVTIYDSVLVVPNSDPEGIMPETERFDQLRKSTTRTSTVLFDDQSQTNPLIHFNAQFLTANKILTDDIDFIYAKWLGKSKRGEEDVYVNNTKLVEPDIFCKNGFVHRVDEVLLPLDNLAETIRKTNRTKLFSGIVERFAAVAYSRDLTDAYNNSKGTNYDSVFIKRYYSDRSYGSTAAGTNADKAFDLDKDDRALNGSLIFDPGWNGMYPQMTAKGNDAMMEDMMVMLVPTNEALKSWWDEGAGLDIHTFYAPGETDTKAGLKKVPESVLAKLVNAGMLTPFTTTIPSNFENILDDANMKLGITEGDIDSVMLTSNGLIYLTNRVFSPTDYRSVLSPAVIDTVRFSMIQNAIECLKYEAYLNSMVSHYTFLLPENSAMENYVDPVSFYYQTPQMWQFGLDRSKAVGNRLSVGVYNCDIDDAGNPTPLTAKPARTLTGASETHIKDRLEEILDNLIITENYTPTKQFYKTKGNTFVQIIPSKTVSGVDVYATWQKNYNTPISIIDNAENHFNKDNGSTYIVDRMPMGGRKSVAATLADISDFSDFLWVLENSGALSKLDTKDSWVAGDQNYGNLLNEKPKGAIGAEDATSSKKVTYLLNNYHYTMYVPTNAAMAQAFADGLPDATAIAEAEQKDIDEGIGSGDPASHVDSLKEVLLDFVKYHIQDNSLFVDEGFASGSYESGKTELIKSTTVDETTGEMIWDGTYSPGRPYKLEVTVTPSGISVKDRMGNTRHVVTSDGVYNLMAREYWSEGGKVTTNPYTTVLNNSSFVAIHAIDGPLYFDTPNQFKYEYKKLYIDTSAAKRRK